MLGRQRFWRLRVRFDVDLRFDVVEQFGLDVLFGFDSISVHLCLYFNFKKTKNMDSSQLDIDHSEFDPNEYFLDLLKNNNLKQLVDKNLNIQSEIKSFDHEFILLFI